MGDTIRIYAHKMKEEDQKHTKDQSEVPLRVQNLKRALPRVMVKAWPKTVTAAVKSDDDGKEQNLGGGIRTQVVREHGRRGRHKGGAK